MKGAGIAIICAARCTEFGSSSEEGIRILITMFEAGLRQSQLQYLAFNKLTLEISLFILGFRWVEKETEGQNSGENTFPNTKPYAASFVLFIICCCTTLIRSDGAKYRLGGHEPIWRVGLQGSRWQLDLKNDSLLSG